MQHAHSIWWKNCRHYVQWQTETDLLYYQSGRAKYGRERTKIIFLLLQLHNRSIDCILGPFASGVLRRLVCVRNLKAFWGIIRNQYLLYASLPPYQCSLIVYVSLRFVYVRIDRPTKSSCTYLPVKSTFTSATVVDVIAVVLIQYQSSKRAVEQHKMIKVKASLDERIRYQ